MEHIDTLLFHIREAQTALEDNYPEYRQCGKDYMVRKACESLRRAHQIASYINTQEHRQSEERAESGDSVG